MRGIAIEFAEQPGLCRKTRPAIAAARVAMVGVEATFVAMEHDACLHLGMHEECAASIADIIEVCKRRDDLYFLPEFFRMRGEALLRLSAPPTPQALECLWEAHDLACRQEAPLFQWRALKALERHLDCPDEKSRVGQRLKELAARHGALG